MDAYNKQDLYKKSATKEIKDSKYHQDLDEFDFSSEEKRKVFSNKNLSNSKNKALQFSTPNNDPAYLRHKEEIKKFKSERKAYLKQLNSDGKHTKDFSNVLLVSNDSNNNYYTNTLQTKLIQHTGENLNHRSLYNMSNPNQPNLDRTIDSNYNNSIDHNFKSNEHQYHKTNSKNKTNHNHHSQTNNLIVSKTPASLLNALNKSHFNASTSNYKDPSRNNSKKSNKLISQYTGTFTNNYNQTNKEDYNASAFSKLMNKKSEGYINDNKVNKKLLNPIDLKNISNNLRSRETQASSKRNLGVIEDLKRSKTKRDKSKYNKSSKKGLLTENLNLNKSKQSSSKINNHNNNFENSSNTKSHKPKKDKDNSYFEEKPFSKFSNKLVNDEEQEIKRFKTIENNDNFEMSENNIPIQDDRILENEDINAEYGESNMNNPNENSFTKSVKKFIKLSEGNIESNNKISINNDVSQSNIESNIYLDSEKDFPPRSSTMRRVKFNVDKEPKNRRSNKEIPYLSKKNLDFSIIEEEKIDNKKYSISGQSLSNSPTKSDLIKRSKSKKTQRKSSKHSKMNTEEINKNKYKSSVDVKPSDNEERFKNYAENVVMNEVEEEGNDNDYYIKIRNSPSPIKQEYLENYAQNPSFFISNDLSSKAINNMSSNKNEMKKNSTFKKSNSPIKLKANRPSKQSNKINSSLIHDQHNTSRVKNGNLNESQLKNSIKNISSPTPREKKQNLMNKVQSLLINNNNDNHNFSSSFDSSLIIMQENADVQNLQKSKLKTTFNNYNRLSSMAMHNNSNLKFLNQTVIDDNEYLLTSPRRGGHKNTKSKEKRLPEKEKNITNVQNNNINNNPNIINVKEAIALKKKNSKSALLRPLTFGGFTGALPSTTAHRNKEKEIFDFQMGNSDLISIRFENSIGSITDNIKIVKNTSKLNSQNIRSKQAESIIKVENIEKKKKKKVGCFFYCF